MKLDAQRLTWFLALGLLLAFVAAQLQGWTQRWPLFPEDRAFLMGLLLFWLLANNLIFGYGRYMLMADRFLAGASLDEGVLRQRAGLPEGWPITPPPAALFAAWLADLDRRRYAYYAVYGVMALFTLLTRFNLLGYDIMGNFLEGAFWGASVATFLLFALDLYAHTYPEALQAQAATTPADPTAPTPTQAQT
jgi:hypothetical protein